MAHDPKRRSLVVGETALTFADAGEIVSLARGFDTTVNGLVVEGAPTFEAWSKVGAKLRVIERGAQFALGDFINYGEARFGEQASQEIDPASGWSQKTIDIYAWLARKIAREHRRMDRLGVHHHILVAGLHPEVQVQWLAKAAADTEPEPWSVARLKSELALAKVVQGAQVQVETDFYLTVGPMKSGQVQSDLLDRLHSEGLTVEAYEQKRRVKTVKALAETAAEA